MDQMLKVFLLPEWDTKYALLLLRRWAGFYVGLTGGPEFIYGHLEVHTPWSPNAV
jgi:hypothetical protein